MRPLVESPKTHELRVGRGFSRAELKNAGITIRLAKKFGIAVDVRRRSVYQQNVERLKKYVCKLFGITKIFVLSIFY